MSFKSLSLDQAYEKLCAPGAKFEVLGGKWKNQPPTLKEIFLAGQLYPDREFLVYGEARVTYAVFGKAVLHLAQRLSEKGIKAGDRVALRMRNRPEWPVVFFAVALSGGVSVLANPFWSEEEERAALAGQNPVLILDPENLKSWLPGTSAWKDLQTRAFPDVEIGAADPAAVFFTSGSTGEPRPVLLSHQNITTSVMTESFIQVCEHFRRTGKMPAKPAHSQVTLLAIPFFHVAGACAILIPQMYAGNKIILMEKWGAETALSLIEKEKVNFTGGVPSVTRQILHHPAAARSDLSSLRLLSHGGAPAPAGLDEAVRERGLLSGNGWGMTETSGTFMGILGKSLAEHPGSCGAPLPVGEIKISAEGELWVKGPQVVHVDADGWLKTGDLVTQDGEGYCYITGRLKDIIIRNGEKITAAEVERALLSHPAVLDAVAAGLVHPVSGEEVGALVELKAGAVFSAEQLRAELSGLSSHKKPGRIVFGEIPRTSTGKADRRRAAAILKS